MYVFTEKMIGITYHEDYNKYDLGVDHPLIGDKPKKTMDFLEEKNITKEIDIFKPTKATEEDLLRVHSKNYVDKVKQLSKTGGMLSFDTPAPKGIFEISRLAAGGTILCSEKLFKGYNIMINPLSGFHHASINFSSGFCFFNDIAIAAEYMKKKYNLKKIMIVDLDVHHANGTQEIFYDDPNVLNISIHQDGRTLYPGTGSIKKIGGNDAKGYNINIPLPPEVSNKSYLYAFDEIIPKIIKQFNPELLIYQCGVDTHHSDPLADLKVNHEIFYTLAEKMKKLSKMTCDKLLVLFGGGYNSQKSIISYYNIICGLLGKSKYIKEEELEDIHLEEVKEIIKEVKLNLNPFWEL